MLSRQNNKERDDRLRLLREARTQSMPVDSVAFTNSRLAQLAKTRTKLKVEEEIKKPEPIELNLDYLSKNKVDNKGFTKWCQYQIDANENEEC